MCTKTGIRLGVRATHGGSGERRGENERERERVIRWKWELEEEEKKNVFGCASIQERECVREVRGREGEGRKPGTEAVRRGLDLPTKICCSPSLSLSHPPSYQPPMFPREEEPSQQMVHTASTNTRLEGREKGRGWERMRVGKRERESEGERERVRHFWLVTTFISFSALLHSVSVRNA